MFDTPHFSSVPHPDRSDDLRREADARRLAGRTRLWHVGSRRRVRSRPAR